MKRVFVVVGVVVLLVGLTSIPDGATATPSTPSSVSTACDGIPIIGNAALTWSRTSLWPPNHTLRDITITYADPDGTGLGVISIDIGQIAEYPAETNGAGDTSPDWEGANSIGAPVTDDETASPSAPVRLRAERSGHDSGGRIYVIPVTCHHDAFPVTKNVCISVPHSRRLAVVPDPALHCAVATTSS